MRRRARGWRPRRGLWAGSAQRRCSPALVVQEQRSTAQGRVRGRGERDAPSARRRASLLLDLAPSDHAHRPPALPAPIAHLRQHTAHPFSPRTRLATTRWSPRPSTASASRSSQQQHCESHISCTGRARAAKALYTPLSRLRARRGPPTRATRARFIEVGEHEERVGRSGTMDSAGLEGRADRLSRHTRAGERIQLTSSPPSTQPRPARLGADGLQRPRGVLLALVLERLDRRHAQQLRRPRRKQCVPLSPPRSILLTLADLSLARCSQSPPTRTTRSRRSSMTASDCCKCRAT